MEEQKTLTVIGGGTGLSTILRGLKRYKLNLNAIVTVSDDGGSSGKLSEDLGVLPPGDIRNCLVALADEESLMAKLFQYRFTNGDLKGHSFGNLFLVAMAAILGDFLLGIKETSKVLAIRGRVLPSTLNRVKLKAYFEDGTVILGETSISSYGRSRIKRIELLPVDLDVKISATLEAINAIEKSDLIIIGPGSLYTSIIPNLLLKEIQEVLKEVSDKKNILYICNVMTQPGETLGYKASDHLRAIIEHLGFNPINYILVNTKKPSEEVLRKYRERGADFVEPDFENLENFNINILSGDFINDSDLIRHDSFKVADFVVKKFIK
ncbi:MAG: YvcK family protein [Dictyoglomus thermophilum]|nr:gluconeogenesis factor YvcK family protein [Dictyoglomus thermophilum]MCX7721000.1 YvcK family protein [Dictyoglomus thermophilum]